MNKNPKNEILPSLSDLLTEDTIILKELVADWREAIEKAGEALVKTGAVEPRYIPAMMKFKEELGPYIVIAPGIALPHSRPEDGVLKPRFCLMTLKRPVEFGHEDNDPVDIVIAFAAVDNKQHIKALALLANLLSDSDVVKKIRKAKSKKEILSLIPKS